MIVLENTAGSTGIKPLEVLKIRPFDFLMNELHSEKSENVSKNQNSYPKKYIVCQN